MKPFSFHILFDVVKQRVEIREFVHHQRIYSIVPTQIRGDRREEGGRDEITSRRVQFSSTTCSHTTFVTLRQYEVNYLQACGNQKMCPTTLAISSHIYQHRGISQLDGLSNHQPNHHLHYSIMKTKASQYKGFDIVSLCLNWALKNSPACNKDPKTIFNRKSCSGLPVIENLPRQNFFCVSHLYVCAKLKHEGK